MPATLPVLEEAIALKRQRMLAAKRAWYWKHKKRIRAAQKAAYAANPEPVKARAKKWAADNPIKAAARRCKYHKQPHVRAKRQARLKRKFRSDPAYRARLQAKTKARLKRRYHNNPAYRACVRARQMNKWKRRYHVDPAHRIRSCLRSRMRLALHGSQKCDRSNTLIGCSTKQLMQHLESLFKPGMAWNNYGSHWQIDHKRPCASFNLLDPDQQRQCFHYTNLQPLWAMENMLKGDKY